MRAVVQRVREARVLVDGELVGEVGRGLLVLLCAMQGDVASDADWMLRKLTALRIFPDEAGRMNLGLEAVAGTPNAGVLLVSQFTLSADLTPKLSKGNRPAFVKAMAPESASAMVDAFAVAIAAVLAPLGLQVATGRFGADMQVGLVNDGPVTLWFDSRGDVSGLADALDVTLPE